MIEISTQQLKDYQSIENCVHNHFIVLTKKVYKDYIRKMRAIYPSRNIRWRGKFVRSLIAVELHRINDYIAQQVTQNMVSSYRDIIVYSILYARLAKIGTDFIYKEYFKKHLYG